jgi:hypothetical protein
LLVGHKPPLQFETGIRMLQVKQSPKESRPI